MRLSSVFALVVVTASTAIGCIAPSPVHAFVSPGSPKGFVHDYASVLSPEERADLETTARNYEANSTNEVALVTVSSTAEETIETYAVKLFEAWGIGARGEDSGVLILAAIQDRRVRIEVGYGLESVLTDAASAAIIQRALPLFREERYYEALSQILFDVESTLSDYENIGVNTAAGSKSEFETWTDQFIERLPPGIGALLLIVAAFLFFAFGRFFLGFIITMIAYVAAYLFALIQNKPKPVLKRFFAGAMSGFFSGILSGFFRGSGGFGGGSSGGGFGGGRSGGGGSSGGW